MNFIQSQTKLESLLETIIGTAIGFINSTLIWLWVITPIWGLKMSLWEDLIIVTIFTVASIARGYVVRRFFNAGIHKLVHKLAKQYMRIF